MNFCVHLSLGKIIIFIEIKIHHKFNNMVVHSCCCILFCIVWFEITFQNDLNLHSKIWVEISKRKRKGILLLSLYLPHWPVSSRWPTCAHSFCVAYLLPPWPI